MYNFPIGVLDTSFKLGFRESVEKAASLGLAGLQVFTTNGDMAPENLTKEKIHELLDIVKSNGMQVSALCGDFGHGFGNPEKNPELIERSKRLVEIALEFETNIVTTHIGIVPQSKDHERYKIMQEACFELSRYADSLSSHFAIETGPETSAVLKEFLDSLGSRGVAVNLDPANLVMVTGDDPVQAVYTLKDYIVHTHAKDGIKLLDIDPEIIYKVKKAEEQSQGKAFLEVPLGTGKVDFVNYLKALQDIGYKGFLTIEREVGDKPEKDIATAADFLRKIIGEN